MKFLEKQRSIELRHNGLSYSEIKNLLNVSKSTLSNWLKNIELTNDQKNRLSKLQTSAYLGAKKNQVKSQLHHKQIIETAKNQAIHLFHDSFFVTGLMLYWAEGSKNSNRIQFTNSDPLMIKIMMKWFRNYCEIPEEKFRIGLFVHSLHIKEDYLQFWSKITKLPLKQFNRSYIKPTILSNRKNKLYEGTCAIKINSRDLLSKVTGWLDAAKEYFLLKNV